MKKNKTRIYVDGNSSTTCAPPMSTADRTVKRNLSSRLSHDISTDQLLSDELIDGKIADGNEDETDSGTDSNGHTTNESSEAPRQGLLYRIESHSALSSLEAKHLSTMLETRPAARMHKLAPLAAGRNNEAAAIDINLQPFRLSKDSGQENMSVQMQVCAQCSRSLEMPPMHCAAYSGHMACLELLLQKVNAQSNFLENHSNNAPANWLDKKQRTPLFYACAANRLECCALMARGHRMWLNTPDRQMDTPVHVCCFFGWSQCLQLLLDAGAYPHSRNTKGFKPSHLAATPECLEILLAYGDDLLQGDQLGRTPLFVACARDRVLCVEFLCAWNNQSHSCMVELEDHRGDRAIHAAACNGNTRSLAVLLRYGADPLTINSKGMSPKELAVANKHFECEALLVQAEQEAFATADTSWLAPANAVDSNDHYYYDVNAKGSNSDRDWVQCWDNDSNQVFYYNNLTGRCQWDAPSGIEACFPPPEADNSHQLNHPSEMLNEIEDESEEYVWVKKKKQSVCVVTGRETEWTAVQDSVSRAIYYKNTRTGQSQWEEPDAVRELVSATGARSSQEASRVWERLDQCRSALAAAVTREKRRQVESHELTLLQARLYVQQRREDIAKREEQTRLAQLLPRSSFVWRKKQSMMLKVSTYNRNVIETSPQRLNGKSNRRSSLQEESDSGKDEGRATARLEEICASEPALDMFMSTYLKLRGVRDLQVLTPEKRISNCLFHYYVAQVDPVQQRGISKSQFRVVLRDMNVIAGGSSVSKSSSYMVTSSPLTGPPLKLHVVDLIFAQAERAFDDERSPRHASTIAHRQVAAEEGTFLSLCGFTGAMVIVREQVVAQAKNGIQQASEEEIENEDDEECFILRYLVPLSLRLGARLLTQIRCCKELELQLMSSQESTARHFLAANRAAVQLLHRHYYRRELDSDTMTELTPKTSRRLAMLTFRGFAMFVSDFTILASGKDLPALYFLFEAVNWISGSAHTEVISFEKFELLLVMLAGHPLSEPRATFSTCWMKDVKSSESLITYSPSLTEQLITFFKKLAASPALAQLTVESSVEISDADAKSADQTNTKYFFNFATPTDSLVSKK